MVGDFFDETSADGQQTLALVVTVIAAVILAVLAVVALRAAVMFLVGVSDLFATREVVGQVVRLRNNYLAVDDGVRPRVRAWRVMEAARLGMAARGAIVKVTVTPRLGFVHKIEARSVERSA